MRALAAAALLLTRPTPPRPTRDPPSSRRLAAWLSGLRAPSAAQEHDGLNWGLNGELNTGIILLRSTRASLALCDEWIRRMQVRALP